jgi:hypothetical protein
MTKDEMRARVLATANRKPFPIHDVPGWGTVYIKPLKVGDIETFSADADPALRNARGIARVLCNENGETLFDAASVEDLFLINALPMECIAVLNASVEKMNASTKEEADVLGNASPPATDSSST